MARQMTPTARIEKARKLIQQAREIPAPDAIGWEYFSYTAQVKDVLRQANDLIKLISYSPSTPAEVKEEARLVAEEITQAEAEILNKKSS